jgi:hypothetical protein
MDASRFNCAAGPFVATPARDDIAKPDCGLAMKSHAMTGAISSPA